MTTSAPSAAFWDRTAERYALRPIADEAAYRHKLRATREHLRVHMSMLEIGCGTGSTALVHAPSVRHILATDISAKMIAIARRKAAEAGVGNVEFRQAAFECLEPLEAAYDVVLCHSVLHLLSDPAAAVARIFLMLKPGGIFVSSTACLADFMGWIRWVAPVGRAVGLLPPVTVFGSDDLDAAFARAGFRIEQRWQPGPRKPVFIIARKPGPADGVS